MNQRKSKNDRESKIKYWQEIFSNWENSGLNQKDFCQSTSVCYSAFKNWRYKLKNQQTIVPPQKDLSEITSPFVPISIRSSKSAEMVLTTPSGYSLNFPETICTKQLVGIISALKLF